MTVLSYEKTVEHIDKSEIEGDHSPLLGSMIQTGFFLKRKSLCKYCGTRMSVPVSNIVDGGGGWDHVERIYQCDTCAWWWEENFEDIYLGEGDRMRKHRTRYGVLERFDPKSIDVPIAALRETIRKSPDILYQIHPTKFEELVGSVLKDHMDCEVHHVGKTGDGGIDLILVKAQKRFVVQVKRRTHPDSTEGIAPIRELIGAMILTGHKNGIFVSTSEKFSLAAKVAAVAVPAKTKEIERIELIDCPSFAAILELTRDKLHRPWEKSEWQVKFW